jgi:hypothetical protein
VIVYMTVETAICPACCEDHEYEYDRGDRAHYCEHCGQEPPADWYDGLYDDGGLRLIPLGPDTQPTEPLGVPASSLNGNAAESHTDPAGWANWVAFCERNGLP